MKNVIIFTTLFILTLTSFSQNRKDLTISLSTGLLNSPYYKNAKPRHFVGFDFDYHLTKRHMLSVNYFAGNHHYYEDLRSNDPTGMIYSDGSNAHAGYKTFSIEYKYKVINNNVLSLVPGVGAGIMTHSLEYPYKTINSGFNVTSSYSDLVFPISLDVNFKLSQHWQTGLTGGFLIHPDYPILALHAGPKLSYVIR